MASAPDSGHSEPARAAKTIKAYGPANGPRNATNSAAIPGPVWLPLDVMAAAAALVVVGSGMPYPFLINLMLLTMTTA